MYNSLLIPWSPNPSPAESLYRSSGLVKTKGTIFLLPPSDTVLRSTYNAPPRPQTRMSSGAVALCKHFERGGASSEHGRLHPFWTLPRGSNEQKTATAATILELMLSELKWKNVMMLRTGVAVYEARNGKGYGMRWTLELELKAYQDNVGGNQEVGDNVETATDTADYEAERWQIKKTTFRGFLEPIADMGHELSDESS